MAASQQGTLSHSRPGLLPLHSAQAPLLLGGVRIRALSLSRFPWAGIATRGKYKVTKHVAGGASVA
jgi:hypothetical protein